jgi:YVTN family beta-propeller protein
VIATLPTGSYPLVLGFNPLGNKVYCANRRSDNVTVIDGISDTVIAAVPAGSYPIALAYNPVMNRMYCANRTSGSVTVIDGVGDSVIDTAPILERPYALAYCPNGNKLYAACYGEDAVAVIACSTNTMIANVPTGAHPYAMKIGTLPFSPRKPVVSLFSAGNKVYCANNRDDNVAVIDAAGDSVIALIPVGNEPRWLTYVPTYNRVYCANYYGNSVSAIDCNRDAVIATVTVGARPIVLADNPQAGRVYAANAYGSSVSVLLDRAGIEKRSTLDASRMTLAVWPTVSRGMLSVGNHGGLPLRSPLLLAVHDISGRRVRQLALEFAGCVATVDMRDLPNGVYFVSCAAEATRREATRREPGHPQKVVIRRNR